jgi:hypothetical protein
MARSQERMRYSGVLSHALVAWSVLATTSRVILALSVMTGAETLVLTPA